MEQLGLFSLPLLSVTEITRYLRQVLETDEILQNVWVQGEVSNLARPSSGHIYFTLKDQSSALRCVMWKPNVSKIRFPLQNGVNIEVHGYISLYERDGNCQLYADVMRPAGEGALFQEFLRLKARLEAEGLFGESRKRPLPSMPTRIGLVTSPTGAALQDILNTLRKRYPIAQVFISPTSVQGENAPPEIVAALKKLARTKVEVIILARGGGSIEDLWAFNDESVVRAVVNSPVPVITGIGHETDFTLADFAADLRAPTPTGAAVLATPEKSELKNHIDTLVVQLNSYFENYSSDLKSHQEDLQSKLERYSPLTRILAGKQRVDELDLNLKKNIKHFLQVHKLQANSLTDRLESLNPKSILKRGYAIVRDMENHIIKNITQVRPAMSLNIQLSDGDFQARSETPPERQEK